LSEKISTREIDTILSGYTETELSSVKMESMVSLNHEFLFVHLSDQTLVFCGNVTAKVGKFIWFFLSSSSSETKSQYRARSFIWVYNKWMIEDPTSSNIGYLDLDTADHYESSVRWEFQTTIIYNQGRGAIFRRLELIGLTGRNASSTNPTIYTDHSYDGLSWSTAKSITIGSSGNTTKRLVWFPKSLMKKTLIQRFYGTSDARLSVSALEVELQGLNI